MKSDAKILVAGSQTLLGAALVRELRARGHENLVAVDGDCLREAAQCDAVFSRARPEYVFVAAGRSGGIGLNVAQPADLILDNLAIITNVLPGAQRHGAQKTLYLASSCCYPRLASQPLGVAALGTGPLEPTNEAYATAKIAGLVLCRALRKQHGASFIAAIPANDFGPGDDFSPDGHVIAALLRRMHDAKENGAPQVATWGSGSPQREFVFADDVADACLFLMDNYDDAQPINIGSGDTLSICELAFLVREVVGYAGELFFDASRPDGMPLKSLDSSPLQALGWRAQFPLREALRRTYEWFLSRKEAND